MRRVSRFVCRGLIGGSLIALACALGAGAQAQSLGPLVQITQGDPFSLCTADNILAQEASLGSTLYPNTAIEPWVAVDPTDPNRLLVGHQQDRWNNGGSRGLVGNISTDGGSTWSNTIPTGVTECTGGDFVRSSDPWTSFALDGTAFFFHLVDDPSNNPLELSRLNGMLVSRSTDHAQSWGAPTALILDRNPAVFNDKNSITADPTSLGHVYAVWDRLDVFPLTAEAAALLAENDGVVIARELAAGLTTAAAGGGPFFNFAFKGPTFLSRSESNGDSWSTAVPIFDPGVNAQTIDNLVVVRPNGDVFDFFTNISNTGALSIDFIRSTDKGAHWSGPTVASDIQVFNNASGVITPDSGAPVRDAAILYAVAVDPGSALKHGNLYLAWQDDRSSLPSSGTCTTPARTRPIDSIAFSQSLDGGATWSKPVQINKTPLNAAHPCRQQAFVPAVVVAGDGTVVVTYYDVRHDAGPAGVFEGADYFAVFCKPGKDCSMAGSWGNERQLTTAPFSPFNILDAPVARGHFLGDYMGLAASGANNVFPVFGIPIGHNETADFTRKITLP